MSTTGRVLVTGVEGQVARCLVEAGRARGVEVLALGRPRLDLEQPAGVEAAIRAAAPAVVVSSAAYTAVDKAESERERAFAVNQAGAAAVARAAAAAGASLIHLSTDYVFDGDKAGSYREDDPTAPLGVYGASKLAGEHAVAAACPDHVVLRLAWVFSPFGANFVKTMLRLGGEREALRVVDDQLGRPTSAQEIAEAALDMAVTLRERPGDAGLRGLFHLAPQGCASWADFAEAIFAASRRRGGPSARVERIATADFPTPARRPKNSRLDGAKLAGAYGIAPRPWTEALDDCIDRLLRAAAA